MQYSFRWLKVLALFAVKIYVIELIENFPSFLFFNQEMLMHETNDVFKMPICLNEVLLRIRQLCVRSQLGSHALRSRSGGLGTQDFQVLRQSCYGAVLVIRIVRF